MPTRPAVAALLAAFAAGCSATQEPAGQAAPAVAAAPAASPLEAMIDRHAAAYGLPADLVHRVVRRESNYDPAAYNAGNWGLMQIRHGTARTMGYRGPAEGLLDPETNLTYAVKYLRGAWLVAGGDADRAIRLYQRGYYYDAKRKGLLVETGLRPPPDGAAAPVAAFAGPTPGGPAGRPVLP